MNHPFNNLIAALWLLVGLVVGVFGWTDGNSWLVGLALKLTSGYGAFLLIQVSALALLSLLTRSGRPATARYALGDFHNLLRITLGGLTRASGVLLGVALVAAVCWCVTGSGNALVSALIGGFIASVLIWFWVCLRALENHLPLNA